MNKMGADIKIDGNLAVIYGGRPLTGTQVQAGDLRGGAALIIRAYGRGRNMYHRS